MTEPRPSPAFGPEIRRLARDYLPPNRGGIALACALMLLAAAGTATLAWLLDPALRLIFQEKRQDWLTLMPLIVAGVALAGAAAAYGASWIISALGQKVVASLQTRMVQNLVRADLAMLDGDHSAAQAARFTYDAALVRDMVTRGITGIAREVPTVLLLIGVMFWQDWTLALVVLSVLPLGGLAMRIIHKLSHRAAESGLAETGALSTAVGEAITGRRIIKAYGLETQAAARAEASIARRLAALIAGERASAATVPVSDALGGVGIAAIIAYAGWRGLSGGLQLESFLSFIVAALMAFQPIRALSSLTSVFAQSSAALARIHAIIDARPAIADAPDAQPLALASATTGPLIAFSDVAFAYGEGIAAVEHVSFTVKRGATVALVGPSGAGKSTILNLLLRFYDPSAGTITVGGANIRTLQLATLRTHMALVTQDAFLFDDTIAANIACGRMGATQADIERAAKAAEAHDFIMALPDAYGARVGESGGRLSGGQRQRIAIARAILRDAPILLLDEATSALDAENEARVQAALAHLMDGRTTLVIAHRLSTIMAADDILVFDKGRIVEQGRHADLVSAGGLYARLYAMQFATREA